MSVFYVACFQRISTLIRLHETNTNRISAQHLLVLWLTLQQEGLQAGLIWCSPDLSDCLGAGYTCSAMLLFLGVEECHCLFAASHDTHRVQLELIAVFRRKGATCCICICAGNFTCPLSRRSSSFATAGASSRISTELCCAVPRT